MDSIISRMGLYYRRLWKYQWDSIINVPLLLIAKEHYNGAFFQMYPFVC